MVHIAPFGGKSYAQHWHETPRGALTPHWWYELYRRNLRECAERLLLHSHSATNCVGHRSSVCPKCLEYASIELARPDEEAPATAGAFLLLIHSFQGLSLVAVEFRMCEILRI